MSVPPQKFASWLASGTMGQVVVGVQVLGDSEASPARMGFALRASPESSAITQQVLGNVRATMLQFLSRATYTPYSIAEGIVWIAWTQESRAAIHGWFAYLSANGFPSTMLDQVRRAMDSIPILMPPTGGRVSDLATLPAQPPNSLLRIDNLAKCMPDVWAQVEQLPGAFVIMPAPASRPVPVRSRWTAEYFERRKEHPSPVYISAYHIDAVSRIFSSFRTSTATIRQQLGIDYPIYPPTAFPVPGVNPDNGKQVMLHQYQAGAISKFFAMKRMLLAHPLGCHQKGQGILMFDGTIKPVEEVAVGDRLMGPDSTPRMVLSLCRGHGKMVRIVPIRGDPFVVNEDHVLTLVQSNAKTAKSARWPCQYRDNGRIWDIAAKNFHSVPKYRRDYLKLFSTGVTFTNDNPIPIDPYFLGVLLGDGGLARDSINITSMDPEIIAYCKAQAAIFNTTLVDTRSTRCGKAKTYRFARQSRGSSNRLIDAIRLLELFPIKCERRFIPHQYLVGSNDTRAAMLAGLMDTDGYMGNNTFDYCSKSERLANGVAFLARSLGLSAICTTKYGSAYPGHKALYWRVKISGNTDIVPCKVPRKRCVPRNQKKDALRTGFSIEALPDEDDYYGFTLNGDGRYLLDNFMVTHNSGKTVSGLAVADTLLRRGIIDRVVIISPLRAMKKTWGDQLQSFYGHDAVYIDGTPLDRTIAAAEAIGLKARFIITGYDTWRLGDVHMVPQQFSQGRSLVRKQAKPYIAGKEVQRIRYEAKRLREKPKAPLSALLDSRTLVIIDEAHNLKHADTKRYKAIHALLDGHRWDGTQFVQDLSRVVQWRMLITGTPSHDKPSDVYGPLNLLSLHLWNSFQEFASSYFHQTAVRTGKVGAHGQQIIRQKIVKLNPDRKAGLQEIIANVSDVKTLEEIGIYLPPVTRYERRIEPTGLEMAAYRVIKGELDILMAATASAEQQAQTGGTTQHKTYIEQRKQLITTMMMERLFSTDPALLVMSESPTAIDLCNKIGRSNLVSMSPGSKIQSFLEWVGDFLASGDGKAVVFSSFPSMFNVIRALFQHPERLGPDEQRSLKMLQMHCAFFSGEMSRAQSDEVVNRFKSDPNVRILMSSDAGGVAQNWQHAYYITHFDENLSYGNMLQREGRVYRQGQTTPVIITTMRLAPEAELRTWLQAQQNRFIDPRLRLLLAGKADEVESLMGGV